MKLIIGLGNPGKEYDKTRHNTGFIILDNYLADEKWDLKFEALYLKKRIKDIDVIFLKPQTFVNLSGNSIIKFVNYFDIKIEDILVIQDDLDQDVGKFKLKQNSSSGGHNGIKSIISHLNSNAFLRLKVGINNTNRDDVVDFVLGKFSKKELDYFKESKTMFSEIIECFILNGAVICMNKYNRRK